MQLKDPTEASEVRNTLLDKPWIKKELKRKLQTIQKVMKRKIHQNYGMQ